VIINHWEEVCPQEIPSEESSAGIWNHAHHGHGKATVKLEDGESLK